MQFMLATVLLACGCAAASSGSYENRIKAICTNDRGYNYTDKIDTFFDKKSLILNTDTNKCYSETVRRCGPNTIFFDIENKNDTTMKPRYTFKKNSRGVYVDQADRSGKLYFFPSEAKSILYAVNCRGKFPLLWGLGFNSTSCSFDCAHEVLENDGVKFEFGACLNLTVGTYDV